MLSLINKCWISQIRVRYAPSPTGPMHLGAVRTALFNYLYAKKNDGKFILRIEDTDSERNVIDGAKHIYETLRWLGIQPDQSFMNKKGRFGPYIQSERLKIYKQIEQQFITKGYAYPCFCESKQKNQTNQKQGYDGRCRKLGIEQIKQKIKAGQKYVIRIKSDLLPTRITTFNDENYGQVKATDFDDFIIVKSNRVPTYHFANVIDDYKMKITHVIRGAQWLTNTPKHIYLYKLLKVDIPQFMHLPLLFTKDGKKLSKRDPTAPIDNLRAQGYQPEAIINYTGLLGYRPQSQPKSQFQNLQQLIEIFNVENLTNSPIKSDQKKLNFYNRHYIRQKWKKKDQKFIQQIRQYLRECHNITDEAFSDEYIDNVINCIIDRVNKPSQFKQYQFFFKKQKYPSKQTLADLQKLFGSNAKAKFIQKTLEIEIQSSDPNLFVKNQKIIHNLLLIFDHVIPESQFNEETIGKKISEFLVDHQLQIKNQQLFHLLRIAVIGRKSGPNIVRICSLFGKQRVIQGLNQLKTIFMKNNKIDGL